MARYRELLKVTEAQREELTRWAQSRTLPAGDVFRAKLILALSEGWTWARIATTLRTSKKTIAVWKTRSEEGGIDGLEPRHKGSQPKNDPAFEEKATDIIGLYMIRRSMLLYFASMRRRPFKRWTGWFRCCRFHPGAERHGFEY